jgi:hypothetical protein
MSYRVFPASVEKIACKSEDLEKIKMARRFNRHSQDFFSEGVLPMDIEEMYKAENIPLTT